MNNTDKDRLVILSVALVLLEGLIAFFLGMNYEQLHMHVEPCKLDSNFNVETPTSDGQYDYTYGCGNAVAIDDKGCAAVKGMPSTLLPVPVDPSAEGQTKLSTEIVEDPATVRKHRHDKPTKDVETWGDNGCDNSVVDYKGCAAVKEWVVIDGELIRHRRTR